MLIGTLNDDAVTALLATGNTQSIPASDQRSTKTPA